MRSMQSLFLVGLAGVLAASLPSCTDGNGNNNDAGTDSGPTCDPHGASGTTFVDATQAWGLGSVVGNRIVSADLDGDGYPDLIIHAIGSNNRETIGTPPKLVWVLMNRPNPSGGRQFVDATQDSGLFQVRGGSTTQFRSAHIASVGDVDNDGDLDVFSGTYVDPTNPTTDTGDRSEIMINDGTGHFTLAPVSDPHPIRDGPLADDRRDDDRHRSRRSPRSVRGLLVPILRTDVRGRSSAALQRRGRRDVQDDHESSRLADQRVRLRAEHERPSPRTA